MPGSRGSLWGSIVSLSSVLLISFGAISPLPADVLIERGDLWRFFKGTTAPSTPATAWRQADFDDTVPGWTEGPTGIGYGDNDDATVLGDMANGYLAFYARKSFIVANPAALTSLVLEIDYDDGLTSWRWSCTTSPWRPPTPLSSPGWFRTTRRSSARPVSPAA